MIEKKIEASMSRREWVAVLRCIGNRQQYCRQIKPEDSGFKTFHDLDLELEAIKMRLANQLPSAV